MMPLWTTAISPAERCGWALTGVGAPCVAQRVCEMPVPLERCAASACAARSATRAVLTRRDRRAWPSLRFDDREAGRVVAPVLEATDAVDQDRDDIARGGRADDAAHVSTPVLALSGRSFSLGFLTGRFQPTTDVCLRAGHGQHIGRRILGNDAASADGRALAHLDRSNQHDVRPDADIVADLGPVLVGTIVVGGDRAGADVDSAADRRVTDIGRGDWPSRPDRACSPSLRRNCRCARRRRAPHRAAAGRRARCGSRHRW